MKNDKMTILTLLLESFPSKSLAYILSGKCLIFVILSFLNILSRFVILSQLRGLTAAQSGRPNILHLGGRVGCLEQAPCPNKNGGTGQ